MATMATGACPATRPSWVPCATHRRERRRRGTVTRRLKKCGFQQQQWWIMSWLNPHFFDSPPARWGLLDFIRAVLLLRLRVLLLLAVQIPVGTAGPPPRAPDPSGHCRTSTASSRSQWALPDLNRDFQVAMGTAGPQPRLPDRNGHCRTSTATSRSQWALPDLNGKNVRKDVR